MKQLKKTLLTLVALLAVTTGAWAEEQSETITTATKGTTVYTGTHFKITASYNCDADGIYLFSNNHGTATIESLNGENITKIEMHMTYGGRKATKTTTTAGQLVATDSSESANDISVINVNATSVEIGTTVEALDGTVVQIDKFVIYYGAASSGTSGPEVAWDKTSKTGSFTMPGGNVTLEPEYYPQAALTAAPTAINDVPATTDGAIVKAGTVANIGTTETAQGTVMYYVSPTALDDAALLALAADQWTADVPTAESLAQGQAYVYYYVRGNDSDNDAENFSDGDICAEPIQVTLGAAPLWNAEFDLTDAPEADKTGKWSTNIPEGGVTKGQTVTVTYTGTKKVLGVKAEKKSATPSLNITSPVVGQVIGSDGKNYAANATLPDGVTAVAMIAYVGSETDNTTYTHGLAIALADEGSMNWSTAKSTCEGMTPAVTGAAWLLPSPNQWKAMFKANGGNEGKYTGLNTAITTAGGTALQESGKYWSSTEYGEGFANGVGLYYGNAYWGAGSMVNSYLVRACLAF